MKEAIKKKEKTNSKGITLIALVITIIVLLILAGVTINLTLGENGIFKTAEMAGKNYTQAEEQELAGLAGFENEINNIIGGTGNNGGSGTDTPVVKGLLKDIAELGDYVKYDTGTEKGVLTFRVLYNDDTNGLQIISDKNVDNVTLGGDDWTTGKDSYNNAIVTLNEAAYDYAENSLYAIDGRCVGSVPTVGADGTFTAKNTEEVGPFSDFKFTPSSTIEGVNNMKDTDTNYETDYNTMEALEESGVPNILATGEYYWLASRNVASYSADCNFCVRNVITSGRLGNHYLCYVLSGGSANGRSNGSGLRPCISLKSDIKVTGGDGSEATPYELGI